MKKFGTVFLAATILLGGCNGVTSNDKSQHDNQQISKSYRIIDSDSVTGNDDLAFYYVKGQHLSHCITDKNTKFMTSHGNDFNEIQRYKKLKPLTATPNSYGHCERVEYIEENVK